MKPLHIGMVGSRGVPATYGGVEHHVEALGSRLAARGHRVTVFAEDSYVPAGLTQHRGMEVVRIPAVEGKHAEAAVHAFRSTRAAMRLGVDVIHFHAVGPGWPSPLARVGSRAGIVQTIHGLDAERAKWGGPARTMLRGATWLSANVPHVTVTVSHGLARHYLDAYGRECAVIPNGVESRPRRRPAALREQLGLAGGDYLLSLGRLVPEKQPDRLIDAFRQLDTDMRLVVAGGSSNTDGYVAELRAKAAGDPRVVLPGYVYGELLDELLTNAAAFVQPSSLEGLPLTLLEALEAGRPVVASAIAPHCEVLDTATGRVPGRVADVGRTGVPGLRLHDPDDTADLAAVLRATLADLPTETRAAQELGERTAAAYDWDRATDMLESAYRQAVPRGEVPLGVPALDAHR